VAPADAMLDHAALKHLLTKKVVTPAGKRKAVAHLVDAHGMSERRACKAIGCCRMTVTTRANDASASPTHEGDRRGAPPLRLSPLAYLLKREGYLINHKKSSSGSIGNKS